MDEEFEDEFELEFEDELELELELEFEDEFEDEFEFEFDDELEFEFDDELEFEFDEELRLEFEDELLFELDELALKLVGRSSSSTRVARNSVRFCAGPHCPVTDRTKSPNPPPPQSARAVCGTTAPAVATIVTVSNEISLFTGLPPCASAFSSREES